jgi:ElaB/YqjD/DUF883 family membrane-anchored ribosome-binding protein
MSRLAAIDVTLNRIRAKIRQERLGAMTSAKARPIVATTGKDQAFWESLAKYEAELRRLLRGLQGELSALEHRRTLLWRIPRELRYSARQSIDSREGSVLELVELAETVLRELLELAGGSGTLKLGDWQNLGQKATEAIEKIESALMQQTIQQVQKGPAFDAANAHHGLGIGHLAPLVGLLIALIMKQRAERGRGKG